MCIEVEWGLLGPCHALNLALYVMSASAPYSVTLVVAYLGLVDLNYDVLLSTMVLLRQIGVLENWLGGWTR